MSLVYPLTLVKRPDCPTPDTLEGVLAEWHAGHLFKIYQGPPCTVNDSLKLRMAGASHVRFVFTNQEGRVVDHLLELK